MIAQPSNFCYFALATGQGKTFIAGLLHHYYKVIKGKTVTMVVPNEELKVQMINLLGRMGRGMSI